MTDICSLSLSELARKLQAREISAEAATAACLDRIRATEDRLGALLHVDAEVALARARALDAEGPYYGVRVEAANHMTKGGVVANENAQVLSADGTVVPGLYAAGEVTWQSGGYSESVVFGKVAGEHAAAALE